VKRVMALITSATFLFSMIAVMPASGYLIQSTIPQTGGCPQLDRWNLSTSTPLNRRWSISLPANPSTLVTAASAGTNAQLSEVEQAISDSFGAWFGVTGTTFNAVSYTGMIAPLGRVSAANSCSNDQESNVDGLNTICFNQPSMGFSTGVLAFTRIITANAAGVSVGSAPPSSFAGQILDADTLFRNDGQATFATPAALGTSQGAGAYDLESLLAHEIGHWFALDHSAVWRALMFPFAPPPGQFLGDRPTAQAPDGPLADDDRAAIRFLYPDPNDSTNIGSIRGRVLPANNFALAGMPATSAGAFVTGLFGAQVVAVDSDTGSVIAATIGGWSCSPSNPVVQFDGSFDIERLPLGRNYAIYVEPLVGLAVPDDFGIALGDLCSSDGADACTLPPVNTNFNPQFRTGSP